MNSMQSPPFLFAKPSATCSRGSKQETSHKFLKVISFELSSLRESASTIHRHVALFAFFSVHCAII
ncbi:MAG: hypothetical protein QOF48_3966 [Verrucomicrobiota bacterium]